MPLDGFNRILNYNIRVSYIAKIFAPATKFVNDPKLRARVLMSIHQSPFKSNSRSALQFDVKIGLNEIWTVKLRINWRTTLEFVLIKILFRSDGVEYGETSYANTNFTE